MIRVEDVYWGGIVDIRNPDQVNSTIEIIVVSGKSKTVKLPPMLFKAIFDAGFKAGENHALEIEGVDYERRTFSDGDIH